MQETLELSVEGQGRVKDTKGGGGREETSRQREQHMAEKCMPRGGRTIFKQTLY